MKQEVTTCDHCKKSVTEDPGGVGSVPDGWWVGMIIHNEGSQMVASLGQPIIRGPLTHVHACSKDCLREVLMKQLGGKPSLRSV